MSLVFYSPVGFMLLVGVLILKDEYAIRKSGQKRLEARAELAWPVIIDTISGPVHGQTKNISASGAFLVCQQPLYPGEVVKCMVKAPSRSLEIDAEVVWSNTYLQPDKDFPHNGIGVTFKWIPNESRDFLALSVHNYLKSQKY